MRVIAVDDDPEILMVMRELLKDQYLELELCNDPFVAAAQFETKEFDLIISDFEMPEMNGVELFEHLKEQSRIPRQFIFFTSHIRILKQMFLCCHGVDILFVEKPDWASFLKTINAIIKNK